MESTALGSWNGSCPSHRLWTQQQSPDRCCPHICSRHQWHQCLWSTRGSTAQPRDGSPSPRAGCTPIPGGTAFPRPRQGLEAQTPHVQAENSQHKHPAQILGLRHGQTDLFAGCITSSQHRQGWDSSRAGLCPLPKCCSRHVFVNGELKSRDQLLCTQGCGEGWTRASGPSHAFNTKQLLMVIATSAQVNKTPTCITVPLYKLHSQTCSHGNQEENSHLFLRKQDQTLSH